MSSDLPPGDTPPQDGNGNSNGSVELLNIADEMRDSYLTYAMSVIISRALPDVRDGLKPSQRRILVAMNDMNLGPSASTSKCAGIVGETMKRYHPHGEQAIYPTLVRMAQEWNMRAPLVFPQGNFGSRAGMPAAAMRYTEARLTAVAAEMLEDIERDTVDLMDTYDGKYREPIVLPSKFPNLLVNGSDGIAVGMATDIPPHNLGEVCAALIHLLDHPDATIPQLMEFLPGPDFPTGGVIHGRQGILDGYTTGRGKVTLRARAEIVEEGRERCIIIREIPFQQTGNRLSETIANLANEERIKGIRDVRDESCDRKNEPVKIVVYLKQGKEVNPELILNQLYQFSPLEKTVSIILLALVDNQPRLLTLKQMLEEFLRHRREVIRRRTEFLSREAKKRSHIIEGQLIAVSNLDEVIRICREAESREQAKEQLQRMTVAAALLRLALGEPNFEALVREIGRSAEYYMTEAQAEAVVRMQLGQLARLQRDEVMREYVELREKIRTYENILANEQAVIDLIKGDLIELRDRYSTERLTEITGDTAHLTRLDLIPEEEQVVTLSNQGYIKRLPLNTYRAQNRGGRGVSGGSTREEDFIEHFFVASTHAYLLLITNMGQLYWLRVIDIPEGTRTGGGRHINQVLELRAEEHISSVIPVRHLDAEAVSAEGLHLLMATRRGLVKKTSLDQYCRPKKGGIIGIALEEGDSLIGVVKVKPGDEVMLSTRRGMSIRFDEADARPMGRGTYGVKGISLVGEDEVVGVVVTAPDSMLLSVCANGYGKCTPFGANQVGDVSDEEPTEEAIAEVPTVDTAAVIESDGEADGEEPRSGMFYRKQRRGGKGIRDIRTTERNGPVVGVVAVRSDDDVMLISAGGMVTRTHVNQIRVTGRNTQGVRLVNLKDGDTVSSVARIAREDTPELESATHGAPLEG
jgi:DNA gyrase subunit A